MIGGKMCVAIFRFQRVIFFVLIIHAPKTKEITNLHFFFAVHLMPIERDIPKTLLMLEVFIPGLELEFVPLRPVKKGQEIDRLFLKALIFFKQAIESFLNKLLGAVVIPIEG